MRYMIIVRASAGSEAGLMPEAPLLAAMAGYHEELACAGVLLDANALQPSARGWRIRYRGGERSVTDGPFAESADMIAGYTLIQVGSPEEALEWSRRFPNPAGEGQDAEIEVRRVFEPEDFTPGAEIERLRALDGRAA